MQQGSPPLRRPRLRDVATSTQQQQQQYGHQVHHPQQQQQQPPSNYHPMHHHQPQPHYVPQQQVPPPHVQRSPWDLGSSGGSSGGATSSSSVGPILQQVQAPPQPPSHQQAVGYPQAPPQPASLMVDLNLNQVPVNLQLRPSEPFWASFCTYPIPAQARLAPCHLHGVYTQPFPAAPPPGLAAPPLQQQHQPLIQGKYWVLDSNAYLMSLPIPQPSKWFPRPPWPPSSSSGMWWPLQRPIWDPLKRRVPMAILTPILMLIRMPTSCRRASISRRWAERRQRPPPIIYIPRRQLQRPSLPAPR